MGRARIWIHRAASLQDGASPMFATCGCSIADPGCPCGGCDHISPHEQHIAKIRIHHFRLLDQQYGQRAMLRLPPGNA